MVRPVSLNAGPVTTVDSSRYLAALLSRRHQSAYRERMLPIEDLLALVLARARSSDEARRLDVDVVAGVAAAGINRALVPSALGGSEVHPGELFEVIARIAAADGSTGWCTSISAGSNLFIGYVPEAVARETFDDPDAGSAAVFASAGLVTSTVVNGGAHAVMTGRWPFASNCLHSRWIALGAKVQDERGNVEDRPRLVFVPAADITVEDTWHAGGLRATGSHHVRTESLAVDLNRSCTFTDRPWPEGPCGECPCSRCWGRCWSLFCSGSPGVLSTRWNAWSVKAVMAQPGDASMRTW